MSAYKKYIIDGITEKENNVISKYMTVNQLFDTVKCNPFWFKDVEHIVSPAMLAELYRLQIIENTGVKKESLICINEFQNYYKKVSVKQWQFSDDTTGYEKLCWQVERIARKYANLVAINAQIVDDISDIVSYRTF